MQDSAAPSELHTPDRNRDLPPITREAAGAPVNNDIAHTARPGILTDGALSVEGQPRLRQSSPRSPQDVLPQRGLSYAVIAGAIAGVVAALLTIVVTLVFAETFHAASQQIVVDRLTVKTALALAGLELLNFTLCLLIVFSIGVIIGKIAVRRRLGFLAGTLAGAIFSLSTFLVSLISSYPGNLAVKSPALTTGSLVISALLFCLWSIGGGLVSLFGAWVATVRNAYYLRLGG